MFNNRMMSSNRTNWRTPKGLYESLNHTFHFDFDPCPPEPEYDGLVIEWGNSNFVNPPYGTQIKHWIKKGFEESRKGKCVVMLIPSRTDTRYWHDYVMRADEIWFIKGRLKFDDCGKPAPFPSAIIVFWGVPENNGSCNHPVITGVNTVGKLCQV